MTSIGTSDFDALMTDAMDTLKLTFAETVQYCPKTGRAFMINAIFDEAHTVVDTSGEVPFETVKPVLSIATKDLRSAGRKDPERGDIIVIRGKKFGIVEIMPDGRSEIRLVLALGATRA